MIKNIANLGGLILGMSFYNSCVIDVLELLKESTNLGLLKRLNEVLEDARNVQEGLDLVAQEVLILETMQGDD